MLNRYREVDVCKEDINQFISFVKMEDVSDTDLACIAKGILFIKKAYAFPEKKQEHYYNCLVTDMISLMDSFKKSSLRVYYTFFRSVIENFVRVVLRYENINATGVRNMFTELRNRYTYSKEFIDYVEGEYGKCCEVIHSNYNADLKMYQYYEEIVKSDELSMENKVMLIKQLVTFYKSCKKFIVNNECMQISSAFHNQKEVLYYLLGKKLYEVYAKNNKSL
ncbi:hypothetical protein EAI89_19110 [Eubacterium sp. am_0171]|uniref:Uncharacterized protein n=1 Tax=Faecalicatena contorta TaxID=39482 RepID=A0A174CK11_9FIRM|nr:MULTISPECIES: hypothetical protein [Clostridia]MSC85935.1 hypothetical protein [Eubacterium sp. BIOML-A1]MSD08308.1 hypothetical protein [Eubacterium sp. BIOML-A2]RYT12668.1 hypothetical protein EAI89_19110 [Eubacterium sp. am_0171]CUO13287.1 Uncharacterised protein [[Eubacterium] contortum] [Faecalicatena contorta]